MFDKDMRGHLLLVFLALLRVHNAMGLVIRGDAGQFVDGFTKDMVGCLGADVGQRVFANGFLPRVDFGLASAFSKSL